MAQPQYRPDALLAELRQFGISDERVLEAVARISREHFVSEEQRPLAYRNEPLPIGESQTISQPYVVALMLQELRLDGSERVLEIGTGSGYQTALLSSLARSVVSVERYTSLADAARERLAALQCQNVTIQVADGTLGWPTGAPYDAIVVSAAAPEVPTALLKQLADGGRLILPVGGRTAQELVLVSRHGQNFERHQRGPVRFVPLIGQEGWQPD